jgi:hypothetical protein
MPECSSITNQEIGLTNMRGLVEPVRLRSRLLISTTSHQVCSICRHV